MKVYTCLDDDDDEKDVIIGGRQPIIGGGGPPMMIMKLKMIVDQKVTMAIMIRCLLTHTIDPGEPGVVMDLWDQWPCFHELACQMHNLFNKG